MKKFFLAVILTVLLTSVSAFAGQSKTSIDPGWGLSYTTYYTFLSFDANGEVYYDGPYDLGYTLTYTDIKYAVDYYSVVKSRSGYPDVLYIDEHFYFIYYDDTFENILNIFIIDELAFYNVPIVY